VFLHQPPRALQLRRLRSGRLRDRAAIHSSWTR
jgi:hypothetical protein